MTDLPAWLKAEHWYHVFVLLGAAGTLAALTVEIKGIANAHALLLSLGMFFVGIGEWVNHPLQTRLVHPNIYMPGGGKITGYPRNANALGTIFDMLGFALAAIALYKIASAA